MDVREKHPSVACSAPLIVDLPATQARDQELNWWPFGLQDNAPPTDHTSEGRSDDFKRSAISESGSDALSLSSDSFLPYSMFYKFLLKAEHDALGERNWDNEMCSMRVYIYLGTC